MTQAVKKFYTPQEYLALEEKADYRSEYFRGEIFAMAGGSPNHNRIVVNTVAGLNRLVTLKACEAFALDQRLLVKQNGLYTYPDVVVVCGELEFAEGRTDTITNPVVIVEVLSRSTENYDRKGKFELYQDLETLQNYIIIAQTRVYIEVWQRLEPEKWLVEIYRNPDQTLKIPALEAELPISEIYSRVKFEAD